MKHEDEKDLKSLLQKIITKNCQICRENSIYVEVGPV